MQLNAQLKLAFAAAAYLKYLTLLHNVTRWPVLQKVRGHTRNVLPQFVSTGFQVLFHSPPGVLFTFPSRYFFTIAHSYLFSLGGWSRLLPTRFLVSRRTQETLTTQFAYLYGNFTLFVCAFHHILVHLPFVSRVPTTPYFYGLGSFPFARRYSENHFCFLFLQLLRCFSSPGCSPYKYG